MYTASSQIVGVRKPFVTRQPKAVAQKFHPLWLMGTWEDMVAVVSLALFVSTLLFLVIVG